MLSGRIRTVLDALECRRTVGTAAVNIPRKLPSCPTCSIHRCLEDGTGAEQWRLSDARVSSAVACRTCSESINAWTKMVYLCDNMGGWVEGRRCFLHRQCDNEGPIKVAGTQGMRIESQDHGWCQAEWYDPGACWAPNVWWSCWVTRVRPHYCIVREAVRKKSSVSLLMSEQSV